jgi:hypothetical protein
MLRTARWKVVGKRVILLILPPAARILAETQERLATVATVTKVAYI